MLWMPTQIPQEKVGYLDSHCIAWSENAAVLFISNLLGNVYALPKRTRIGAEVLGSHAGHVVRYQLLRIF